MSKSCIKKVWIDPGCITCGTCEFIAPEIFEVSDICHIKKEAQVAEHEEKIKDAASNCPVNVIQYE